MNIYTFLSFSVEFIQGSHWRESMWCRYIVRTLFFLFIYNWRELSSLMHFKLRLQARIIAIIVKNMQFNICTYALNIIEQR